MAWNRPVKSIMEELRVSVDNLNKKAARRVLKEVYDLSPIKTGRYKSNHIVSVGSPSTYYDARRRDYERWYQESLNIINTSPRGSKLFVQQNLPYNRKIEDGSSNQAAQGVYRIAVMKVKLS